MSPVGYVIFGVRGREVFLFSQPRPVARLVDEAADWTPETLADAIESSNFADTYSPLETDLESFNTDPIV